MYLPALSTEKSAPYGVKGNVLAPEPWPSDMKNWELARKLGLKLAGAKLIEGGEQE